MWFPSPCQKRRGSVSGPNVLGIRHRVGRRENRQEEEQRVSVVRRRVVARTSKCTTLAVDSTSVTDVTDALTLTVVATSTRLDNVTDSA